MTDQAEPKNRTITKIKLDGARVHIEYEIERKDGKDELMLKCVDPPEDAFTIAMNGLAIHVADMMEVDNPRVYAKSLTARGVSLSNTDGVLGAVITALKTLKTSNSPLVINTPHKPETPYSEGGDHSMCLSPECRRAIENLITAADRYIDGHRKQMSLGFGVGDQSTPKAIDTETGEQLDPDAPENDPKFLRAAEAMCPTGRDGLTSVTISGAGQTVTLTKETRKNIKQRREALAAADAK